MSTRTVIDLRSDTVTRPTPAMRAAMAAAEVGDDVFGDDPTVNRLEAVAAELVGKEAAMFVPSGTMGNLCALLAHTQPGDKVLLGSECHIYHYEVGGLARVGGLLAHPLPNLVDGSIDVEAVRTAVRAPNIHTPKLSLLCLENTHNRCGGAVFPPETMDALCDTAHELGLAVHLDGARIFNAAVALGVPAARLTARADSIMFCFSKGLGAPVGSILCGDRELIGRARRMRKMLGGGMRQAGVLAAAALYALQHHIDRLAEDHANAKRLAEGLRRFEAFAPNEPQTNIVVVEVRSGSAEGWLRAFADEGVLAVPFGPNRFRMVTHLDVTAADVEEALRRIERAALAIATT